MARRRTTFGKLQRARDKQAKAQAKIERRHARTSDEADDEPEEATETAPAVDQDKVLAELAELHRAFDDDELSLDDFESRKQELTNQLRID
jgi:hypothetical protein